MLEFIKKQWFLSLIAVLLLGTIGFYVYDQNKDNLPSKSVGGKDVVFSVAGTDVTTDEVYDRLYQQTGLDVVYMLFERAVAHAALETTDVMVTKAEVDIEGVKANFSEYYGAEEYEAYLIDALKTMGYSSLDDLEHYFIYTYKLQELLNAYVDENLDTLFADFSVANQPRVVSHVLIMMDDPANPTAEETERFNAAKAAYEAGTTFEDMVSNYSEDTSNNMNKGLLGYVDVNTQFVEPFLSTALSLTEVGQVSEWTQTEYGYHLIRLDATDVETLKEYQEFYTAILSSDPSIQPTIIWNKAKDLGVDFKDNESLREEIIAYLGIEE